MTTKTKNRPFRHLIRATCEAACLRAESKSDLLLTTPAIADSGIGRYQAIRMDANAVFIIDTKDGHLWTWGIEQGRAFLVYSGKVKPGKEMTEIINEVGVTKSTKSK